MELAGYASPGASATPGRQEKEGLAVREQTNGERVKPHQERPRRRNTLIHHPSFLLREGRNDRSR